MPCALCGSAGKVYKRQGYSLTLCESHAKCRRFVEVAQICELLVAYGHEPIVSLECNLRNNYDVKEMIVEKPKILVHLSDEPKRFSLAKLLLTKMLR